MRDNNSADTNSELTMDGDENLVVGMGDTLSSEDRGDEQDNGKGEEPVEFGKGKKKGGLNVIPIVAGVIAVVGVGVGAYIYLELEDQSKQVPVTQVVNNAPSDVSISFEDNANGEEIDLSAKENGNVLDDNLAIIDQSKHQQAQTETVPVLTLQENIPEINLEDLNQKVDEKKSFTDAVLNEARLPEINKGDHSGGVGSVEDIFGVSDETANPKEIEPQQRPQDVIVNNSAQLGQVNDLQELFKKNSAAIDQLDIRVTALENKVDSGFKSQEAVNKLVDERLSKIEAGEVKIVKSNSPRKVSTSRGSSNRVTANSGADKSKSESASVNSSNRANRRNVKTTESITITEKVTETLLIDKRSPKEKAVEPVFEVYSVFSGRIWIKNPDSTLSTYAIGDKIGGKVISRVDENGRKIYTDNGVITY